MARLAPYLPDTARPSRLFAVRRDTGGPGWLLILDPVIHDLVVASSSCWRCHFRAAKAAAHGPASGRAALPAADASAARADRQSQAAQRSTGAPRRGVSRCSPSPRLDHLRLDQHDLRASNRHRLGPPTAGTTYI
jgi:hypothetical protein